MAKKSYKQLGEAAFYPVYAQCMGLDTDKISIAVAVAPGEDRRVVWLERSLLPESLKAIQLRDEFQVDIKVSNANGTIECRNAKPIG